MNAPETLAPLREFKNHDLVGDIGKPGVRYEKRPARKPDGSVAPGLYNAWIWLDNPGQYNSLHHRHGQGRDPRHARGAATRATSTAWSSPASATRRSAPAATPRSTPSTTPATRRSTASTCGCSTTWSRAILACDKPVICRVNGMRIGGGQEIGMACDFSVASDLARFGQAGPKHGSAPIGGATDFLPVVVGAEARDGRLRAVRAVLGARGVPDGHPHRHRARAQGRRQVRRQPAGRNSSAVSTSTAASSSASPRPARRSTKARR